MGYFISDSFRTQPKIYPTHPVATPSWVLWIIVPIEPKRDKPPITIRMQIHPHRFTFPFTSPKKKHTHTQLQKYQLGKWQCFLTQHLRPILKQVDRPNIIVLQLYIYIYIYGLECTTSIIL